MSALLIQFLVASSVGIVGTFVGWWLRGSQQVDNRQDDDLAARSRIAEEVLSRLQRLAERVAADVGEHNERVHEISEELTNEGASQETVLAAVTKLLEANETMEQQLKSAEDRLQEQAKQIETHAADARTDALTGLANRRALDDTLSARAAEAQRHNRPTTFVLIDVDHFKNFNDTYGHLAGDEVLRGVARVLNDTKREMDVAARYGGEEFALIAPGTTCQEAMTLAERVRTAIEQTVFQYEGTELRVAVSVGLAEILPGEQTTPWIQRTDQALYASKKAGRNRTYWHDGHAPRPANPNEVSPPQQTPPEKEPDSIAGTQPDEHEQTDSLTGLGNRAVFRQDIHRRLAEVRRGGAALSIVLVKIDHFDQLVAEWGQPAGQLAIQAAGKFLQTATREMDHLVRYDDTTFGLLLPSADSALAADIAERLRRATEQCPLPLEHGQLQFTVSLGVAEAVEEDDTTSLLGRVDSALAVALDEGGNRGYLHDGRSTIAVQSMLESIGS